MNKKLLLLGLVVLGIAMCTSVASAYTPYNYYGSPYESLSCTNCNYMPYVVQGSTPIRVGGFFGQTSNYLIGLRPGTYYQTPCVQRPSMYYQPCRTGGWFGNYGYGGYGYGSGLYNYGYGNYYGGYYGANYANTPYVYHGPL